MEEVEILCRVQQVFFKQCNQPLTSPRSRSLVVCPEGHSAFMKQAAYQAEEKKV